jgi:superfamily II DNA or RNA helicase
MIINLDLNSVESYQLFLKIKSLPTYRFVGRTAEVPDEYAARLGMDVERAADREYRPIAGLFDYQRDIARIAIEKRKYAVFADCGLGKTLIMLEFAKHASKALFGRKRVLIISPLMVIPQTIEALKSFYPGDNELTITQVRAKDLPDWIDRTGTEIGITNYEALTEAVPKGRLGCLILDECFIAGTMIDTPLGSTPIESVKVGQRVLNAVGIGRVVATKRRMVSKVVRLTLRDGRILVCSENHPFLSHDGWVQCSRLKTGDYLYGRNETVRVVRCGDGTEQESFLRSVLLSELAEQSSWRTSGAHQKMRVVRCGVQDEGTGNQSILRQVMLSEVADESTGACGQGPHTGDTSEDWGWRQSLVRFRHSIGNGEYRTCSIYETDGRSCGASQSFRAIAGNRALPPDSRRQWQTASVAATDSLGVVRGGLGTGVRHFFGQATGRLSDLLQSRSRKSGIEDCHRGGRIQSCGVGTSGDGSEEGRQTGGAWVDRVEVLESGDPEFRRLSGGADSIVLFDLQVDNHPSFSVDGVIVHNSAYLKSHYGKWGQVILRLGAGLEWKLALTGTPAPNDRIEYANHAVFMDAFPTVNSFLARFFVNRGQTQERWEMKKHAVEPFYRALSHWCIFLTDPATYGWQDNAGTLPPIDVTIHEVAMTAAQNGKVRETTGMLFACDPGGIGNRSKLAKIAKTGDSLKPAFIRRLIESWPDRSTLVWCRYNDEQERLEQELQVAASITGTTPIEKRLTIIADFKAGRIKTLISKPRILGLGLNLHIATRQIFSSLHDSYQEYYQAVKRSNRVGSTERLGVHIPVTEAERPMIENVLRKARNVHEDTVIQERIFKNSRVEGVY